MKSYKTILVGINFSSLDEKVIAFAQVLKAIVKPKDIIFYHAIDPESDFGKQKESDIKVKALEKFKHTFRNNLSDNETFITEMGDPHKLLLKKSGEEDVDLMVLGRKVSERNTILTDSLINSAKSSLFLVPEQANGKISNIVIGINFSEESHQSLDAAVDIAHHTGAEIHCLNIYHVPSGYHTSGKDYNEYAEVMKQNAIKASEKFQKKHQYDIPLNFEFVLDDDTDPADKLYEYAKRTNADLICLGSKGLDNFAALFFDTTTEKIVEFSNHIPMLIIRGKKKGRNLIDVIREL